MTHIRRHNSDVTGVQVFLYKYRHVECWVTILSKIKHAEDNDTMPGLRVHQYLFNPSDNGGLGSKKTVRNVAYKLNRELTPVRVATTQYPASNLSPDLATLDLPSYQIRSSQNIFFTPAVPPTVSFQCNFRSCFLLWS